MDQTDPALSERSRRTRDAIVRALIGLAADKRIENIRIGHIASAAGVARSTLYEHFKSRDEIVLASLEPVLLHLANCASGRLPHHALRELTEHLWQGRFRLRSLLSGRTAEAVQRRLTGLIADRRGRSGWNDDGLLAAATASGQLAMLRAWLSGEASASAAQLAALLAQFSAASANGQTGSPTRHGSTSGTARPGAVP